MRKRITISVDADLADLIDAAAKRHNTTVSKLFEDGSRVVLARIEEMHGKVQVPKSQPDLDHDALSAA